MNNETTKTGRLGPVVSAVAIGPGVAIALLAIGILVFTNLKQDPLTWLGLWLDGPSLQTEPGARYVIETFYKDKDVKIPRIAPFVKKEIGGRTYWVTKMEIMGKNAFGAWIIEAAGFIVDNLSGSEYSVDENTFERFLATGDTSLLPSRPIR
jgi:hypothetical protein